MLQSYYSPIYLERFYFRKVMSTVVSMLDSTPLYSLILDFGCGHQFFKSVSNFKNVVGYDILPELSDISDYWNLRPEVIICNHVLEHLTMDKLRGVLDNFIVMKPKLIITGIPTENVISKICTYIWNPQSHFEHKSRLKTIHKELEKRVVLLERKSVLTLTAVSKWGMKLS
jgi:hypothetical protein